MLLYGEHRTAGKWRQMPKSDTKVHTSGHPGRTRCHVSVRRAPNPVPRFCTERTAGTRADLPLASKARSLLFPLSTSRKCFSFGAPRPYFERSTTLPYSCWKLHPGAEMTPNTRSGGQSTSLQLPEVATKCRNDAEHASRWPKRFPSAAGSGTQVLK